MVRSEALRVVRQLELPLAIARSAVRYPLRGLSEADGKVPARQAVRTRQMRKGEAVTVATTAEDVGGGYLRSLDRSDRRATGQVYTPRPVAGFVVDHALDGRADLLEGPVLDPACGAGVFLMELLDRLAIRLAREGTDLATCSGHEALVRAAQTVLRGIDTDGHAVALARAAVGRRLQQLSPGPIPDDFLSQEVRQGDFLATSMEDDGPPRLIIGNPPYVPTDRLTAEVKTGLRARYPTATGRVDLYTVFLEAASRHVALGGRVAFITPDKYLSSQSSAALRDHLSREGSVRTLARFSSHRLFPDAATVPCVTVWERGAPGRPVDLLKCSAGPDGAVVASSARLEAAAVRGPRWQLSPRRHADLADRLCANHPRIREATVRVSPGPATGWNAAFVLQPGTEALVEPELLHPTAGGRDVTAHAVADRGQRMLVPYVFGDGPPRLIELTDYPHAAAWLGRHRKALERRHCVRTWGKHWWDLHDPISEALHLRPSVLVPDLARTNRFAAAPIGVMPQHSLYSLVVADGQDPRLMAALLNTVAAEYLVRSTAPIVKDGYRRYRRQFLLDLPLPVLEPTEASGIIAALDAGDTHAANELADAAFAVEPAEIRSAMEDLPAP